MIMILVPASPFLLEQVLHTNQMYFWSPDNLVWPESHTLGNAKKETSIKIISYSTSVWGLGHPKILTYKIRCVDGERAMTSSTPKDFLCCDAGIGVVLNFKNLSIRDTILFIRKFHWLWLLPKFREWIPWKWMQNTDQKQLVSPSHSQII